jgi:hypothetical protein
MFVLPLSNAVAAFLVVVVFWVFAWIVLFWFLSESLILAQDERWRRA